MQEIIIDEEFKALLPALDPQTYALLEESMLENGCTCLPAGRCTR
jgi:hypothetical protein